MSLARLLTSTTIFAFAATIANAADMPVKARPALPVLNDVSGYVEVYGGWASTEFSAPGFVSESGDGWALGGAGRVNYWANPGMSLQLDAQAEGTSYRYSVGPFDFDNSTHSYLIAGHLNWRDSQRGLLGVFAGAGDVGGGFGSSQRHVVFGGEGQIYWNQFTLYAQGGYNTVVGDSFAGSPSAWFIRGTGRYFFTANTVLEGTLLYANGEIDPPAQFAGEPSVNFDTFLWEAKLEHRFATTPFSAYVKYRGSETKYDEVFLPIRSDFKVTDHRVLVGLKLFMGQDTLLANDRRGATLDVIDPLSIQSGYLMMPRVQP
jgi:hypothetical protein